MTKREKISKIILKEIAGGNTSVTNIAKKATAELNEPLQGIRTEIRRQCGLTSRRSPVPDVEKAYAAGTSDQYTIAMGRKLNKRKVYAVTCAINNTPIHEELWNNILAFCKHRDAELSAVPIRYKNPTSIHTDRQFDIWDDRLTPYLDANRHDIHPMVTLLSDVKIVPTHMNPLSGISGMTGGKSLIIGHPRMHMRFESVLKGQREKQMCTTGAVTIENYTNSLQGAKGQFHHTLGFCIIELRDDGDFHMRQVFAEDDGSFIDLHWQYKDGNVYIADAPKAIVFGDIHREKLSFESNQRIKEIIKKFEPESIVFHDLYDGEPVNPHELENPTYMAELIRKGTSCIKDSVLDMLSFIKDIASEYNGEIVIVNSNHNRFIDRHIINNDWKKDIRNAPFYLDCASALISGKAKGGLIKHIIETQLADYPNVICLDQDESYSIMDVEMGQHGDTGANGSRGSITQFRNLSTKMWIGHGHSPFTVDGVSAVGCQDKDHTYNKGASNWVVGDGLLLTNGKRQHLIYVNGEYTTFLK